MFTRIAAATALVIGCVIVPATQASATEITPMSGSGCTGNPGSNGMKCIYVTGTKLHVDKIKTTLTRNHANPNCGRAHIEIGRNYATTSGNICDGRDFSFTDTVGLSFPNNTKACAWWSNYPEGKACATIHN
ncbi:hypothetical protein ACF08M_35890 [Streptomyces sp. NPDC015032]|uniref:hypothetical protein n=1 Tax=Streptomyces sp. NPDC015032 TaxID=3364937 RepID=UPI0036F89897